MAQAVLALDALDTEDAFSSSLLWPFAMRRHNLWRCYFHVCCRLAVALLFDAARNMSARNSGAGCILDNCTVSLLLMPC